MSWLIDRLKGAGLGALGVALMLGWWTFTGDAGGGAIAEGPLPATVGAGGRLVEVELDASHPVTFRATFECFEDDDGIYGLEELPAGQHRLSFDVDGDCDYAVLECGMEDPQVGAQMAWDVRVDGRSWQQDSMTLDEPLKPGWGFFLQTGWEDGSLDEMLAYHDSR